MSMQMIHLIEQYFQPKIDLIQHLIQYSQNILLITAPAGGGKTAFAHFCLANASPQLKKHLLVITPELSVETMMENIAKGFGMSWPQNGPVSSEAVQKIWTLFVEDAHLLSPDMLESLIRLVNFHQEPRRQLHLVLLGEDSLVAQFSANRITNLVGNYSTVIELGLPSNWQKNYKKIPTPEAIKPKNLFIAPEFGSAVSRDFEDPIMETDIDLLDDLSDTWPQAQGKTSSTVSHEYKHLFSHPVAYGLYLGVIMGVGLWTWQGKEAPHFIPESEELVALSTPAPITEAHPMKNWDDAAPVSESHADPVFIAEAEPEPLPELKLHTPKAKTAKLAQVNINHLSKEKAEKTEKTEKKISPVKLAKQTEKRVMFKGEALHKKTEKAILAKNKNHYTVQLYGSNDAEKVLNFKQTHGLDKAWLVEKKHQGKTWHVLVMGDYPSKLQAEKATARLPHSLSYAKVKPWVRDFSSLQNEIVNSDKKR